MARLIDFELEQLKKSTLKMGGLAQDSVKKAVQALVDKDEKSASEVIEGTSIVDNYEFDIENECVKVLALRQPVAKDLRTTVTILKIITDLDRINDHSKDIAVITCNMVKEPLPKPLIDIPRMSEISQKMISDCLNAFSSENIQVLEDFSKRDDLVDALMDQIRRELFTIMLENPRTVTNANRLLLVASHLERIGDHACNIASRIYYMVTGKRIKFE